MLRLYADPALRGRFVEKAKQEYAPINWEVMKHRYFEMMSGLLGNEPGRTVQGAIPNTAVAEIQSR